MGITAVRRTGAFFVILSLVASAFVVAAPAAFSQGALVSVSVGECDGDIAAITVALEGDGAFAFLLFDDQNVEVAGSYTNAAGHSFEVEPGTYQWIVFETGDPNKVPVDSGSLAVGCDDETTTTTAVEETTTTAGETTTTTTGETTTTTAAETTTTTVAETTTTTVAELTTTTSGPTTTVAVPPPSEANPTVTVQQTTSTTVPAVTASTLPFTGVESGEMAMMAGLAMIGGLGMLLLAGRRDVVVEDDDTGALGRW